MAQDLKRCVIQIRDATGLVRGTGFIIDANTAVTCAHVIEATGAAPGESVTIAFALTGHTCPAKVLANAWRPAEDDDIAILRLRGELPAGVTPAVLGPSDNTASHSFRTFGYPEVGDMQGVWAEGKILGPITDSQGTTMLQLDAQQVAQGMSGVPVLDTNDDRVAGMVTATYHPDETLKFRDAAFATPIEAISRVWPSLELVPPSPSPTTGHRVIHTEGSYIEGSVDTGGGDFVGRDKHIYGDEVHYHYHRPPLGTPFQAPPLPTHYVPRPEVTDALKARLLTDRSVTTPGILVVSAIHGMAGAGKSTLAAALAHDKDVQQHFKDGILWATLGQQPDLLSLLTGWVQVLGYHSPLATIKGALGILQTLLQDKTTLLVVDDVWDSTHAQCFLIGGSRCHVLITTREAVIATDLEIDSNNLPAMSSEQALALLIGKLGRELERTERQQAMTLAKTVGNLPLALKLAAAQIADGISWSELLADLQAEIARLEILDLPEVEEVKDEATLKRRSLRASFNLSLRRLPQDKLERFAWLGILPEDVTLTSVMATTLWDTDVRQAQETLSYLHHKALLERGVPQPDSGPTYRLHDLLHDMARRLLTTPLGPEQANDLPGMGLTLPVAHTTLLERYKKRTQNGLWHTLPNDGYIHTYLTWHMEKAGQLEQIHDLLWEETAEGRNGWNCVSEQLGQLAIFVKDVMLAWRLVEENFNLSQSPLSIGYQCRYALIISSLNTLAKNIPPAMLVALVDKGIWTSIRGLAYAAQIPDSWQQGRALSELAIFLTKSNQAQEALRVTQVIRDEGWRGRAIIMLAPHLPKPLFREALTIAQGINEEFDRALVLARIAPYLPESLINEVVNTARRIEGEEYRAMALTELAPHLPESVRDEALQEALEAAIAIEHWYRRGEALIKLAPCLSEAFMAKAVDAIRRFEWLEGNRVRSKALTEFVPYLPELLKEQVLNELVEIVRIETQAHPEGLATRLAELGYLQEAFEVWRATQRVEELSKLIPYLPEPLVEEAFRELLLVHGLLSVDQFFWHLSDSGTLTELHSALPESLLREVLAVVHSTKWGWSSHRSRALTIIVIRLAEAGHSQEALTEAQTIEEEYKVIALAGIAPYVPSPMKEDLLRAAWGIAVTIKGDFEQRNAINALASRLVELGYVQDSLAVALAIKDNERQNDVLMKLAPHLVKFGHFQEAMTAIQAIERDGEGAEVLLEIIPQLPKTLYGEALTLIKPIGYGETAVKVLTELVPRLSEEALLAEALAVSQTIEQEEERAKVLAGLGPYLPESLLEKAMDATWAIQDEKARAETINGLAPYLPESLLQQTLSKLWRIADENTQVQTLTGMIPYLSEQFLCKVLASDQIFETPQARMLALVNLAQKLPDASKDVLLKEALELIQEIEDAQTWIETFTWLIPKLADAPPPLAKQLLEEAYLLAKAIIEPKQLQINALIALARYLSEAQMEVVFEIIHQGIEDENERAFALVELAPFLPDSLLQEALITARTGKENEEKVLVLAGLVSHLSPDLKDEIITEILEAAKKINNEFSNFKVLTLKRLVPNLSLSHLPEAVNLVKTIWNRVWQSQAVAIIAPLLPDKEREDILKKELMSWWEDAEWLEYKKDLLRRSWFYFHYLDLAALAPHFTEPLLREALDAVSEIKNKYDWYEVFVELVPHLVKFGHSEEVVAWIRKVSNLANSEWYALMQVWPKLASLGHYEEALTVIDMIYEEDGRAKALAEIVSYLPADLPNLLDLLEKIKAELPKIRNELLQAGVMVQLIPRFAEQSHSELYNFWRETLHILAQRHRKDLLLDFQTLAPVIADLGGSEAIEEAFQAIEDVGRWWP